MHDLFSITGKNNLSGLCVFFCATAFFYGPLVLAGAIKASGRDQHIISPVWAKAAFYPAAKIVRFFDLGRFRSRFLGTWTSTDEGYPYKLALTSLTFDSASGELTMGDTVSQVTLRDMRHELYRLPFGNPIMQLEGKDDWYLRVENYSLTLIIPADPWNDRKLPIHTISFCKVALR